MGQLQQGVPARLICLRCKQLYWLDCLILRHIAFQTNHVLWGHKIDFHGNWCDSVDWVCTLAASVIEIESKVMWANKNEDGLDKLN